MKKILLLVIFANLFCCSSLFAQSRFSLKVNAGGNTTFISDFENNIYAGTLIIPDLLTIDNFSNSPFIYGAQSETKNKMSFFGELEADYLLKNNLSISFSLGINSLSYDYKTYYMTGDTEPYYTGPIFADTKTYFEFPEEYGDTKLTYLHSNLLNINKRWNKFTLQGGPAISLLLSQKFTNGVLKTENGNNNAYIEIKNPDAQKILYGLNLAAKYNFGNNIEAIIGGSYMFNSIYQKEKTGEDIYKKSKPMQLRVGLSYTIF